MGYVEIHCRVFETVQRLKANLFANAKMAAELSRIIENIKPESDRADTSTNAIHSALFRVPPG